MPIQTKRIYDPPRPSDGYRVLVDRLWPRGVSRQTAQLNAWMKDLAPSPPLREWFGHRAEHFLQFREKYWEELATDPAKQPLVQKLLQQAQKSPLTLLYAARSTGANHAIVLKDYLLQQETENKIHSNV